VEDRIRQFIEAPGGEAQFNALARDVFAYQYENVALYRRFCDLRGSGPARVSSWRDIPALPADAFKQDLSMAARPIVFLSSGTRDGVERRSRHALNSLAIYRLSAMTHLRRMVLSDQPGTMAILLLGPSAATHPQSSLGAMFGWCVEELGNDDFFHAFDAQGEADIDGAVAWLECRSNNSTPVLLLGVSSALTAVFAELRKRQIRLRLPADSRMIDTGGSKASGIPVLSARGMLKAAWRFLHIPAYLAVNEYGMTEMLSQFYDDALASRYEGKLYPRSKLGPPWVRSLVVDPATLTPLADGQVGILRHIDLANWESISALQTLDLGRKLGRGFELLGRARGAAVRGCSQLLEAL